MRSPSHHEPLAGLDIENLAVNHFEVAVADIGIATPIWPRQRASARRRSTALPRL
jgi:hypothetical protein